MDEIPSSPGIRSTTTPRKSVKMDELPYLKIDNASKDKTIEELSKENQRLRKETQDLAEYKQQHGILKDREYQYKLRIEELSMGKVAREAERPTDRLPMDLPFSGRNEAVLEESTTERESGGFEVPVKTKEMADLVNGLSKNASDDQDVGRQYQLDWSFGSGEFETMEKLSDVTLRTGLLEKIYDMARNSDAFRIELVDNIIIFLKSKAMTVEDSATKQNLQESIGRITDNRNDLQQKLEEGIDDLDERVASCFAGIAEFHDFRKYFTDELAEIKRLNELELSTPGDASFSPLTTSSPLRNAPATLKRNTSSKLAPSSNLSRVRREAGSTLRASGLSISPDATSGCLDCARYRALLRSFRTTQEADLQKQREQEKTIEKLSTAITSTARNRTRALSRSETELMDGVHHPDTTLGPLDFDVTSRRLLFDSPISLGLRQKSLHLGSSDSSRHVSFISTGTITEQTTETALPGSPAKKMSGFGHLMASADKDRVDSVFYQNKISALELEIERLRNNHLHAGDSESPVPGMTVTSDMSADLMKQLHERTKELHSAQMDLAKAIDAGNKLNEVCDEAVKLYNQAKEENEQLRKEAQDFQNTTHDTSVAGVFASTPIIPTILHGPEELKLRDDLARQTQKLTMLEKGYRQLELERRNLDADVSELLNDKHSLQEQIRHLTKREESIQRHGQQTIQQLQSTVDLVKNDNLSLQARLNDLMTQQRPQQSSQGGVESLRKENASLQARIADLTANQSQLVQRALEGSNKTNICLQNRLTDMAADRNRLNDEFKRATLEVAGLRRDLETSLNKANRDGWQSDEILRLRTEVQSLRSRVSLLDAENARLKETSSRIETVDAAGSVKTQEDEIAPLQNRIDDLMKQVARGEIKIEQLTDRMRSRTEAEEQISNECFLLKGQLIEEKKRAKDAAEKLAAVSTTVSELRESSAGKDARIAELETRLGEELKLLSRAQQRFDENNKSFAFKFNLPWSKTKSQVTVQDKRNAPRRSKTFAQADNLSVAASVTLPRPAQTSFGCTVVDNRTATLPSPSSNASTSRVTRVKNTTTTTTTNKVQFESQSSPSRNPSQQNLLSATPKNSPQKNLTAVPEPYLPAQHSHQLKKSLLWFSQKCSICLGDIPGLHHALKCTVCKHIYHSRCSAMQSECAEVTDLDKAETKQRRSLNSGRLSSGASDAAEPKISSDLFLTSEMNKPFEPVYVTLVDETLTIYESKPSKDMKRAVREVIDLNEHRRQATVTCEKIPKEIFDHPHQWSERVNIFAIKVEMGNAAMTKSWFFRAPDILAKSSWTEAIGHLLMETEVDHMDADAHFRNKLMVNLETYSDLEVSSVVIYDQCILLGTDRGLFVQAPNSDGQLTPIDFGCPDVPVLRLGLLEQTRELLAIMGHELSLRKARLSEATEWLHCDLPKLTFTPFGKVRNCHLFEIAGVRLAAATQEEISVYQYNEKNHRWDALGLSIRLISFCPRAQEVLTKSLLFSQEGLIIGLDKYYVFDLKTSQAREFLDKRDVRLSHWTESEQLLEYGMTSTPMGVFPIPSAEAHKRMRKASDREYLLCFYDGGVFVDGTGRMTRSHEISWKRLPHAIYYMNHFIYVIHYNSIQVRKVMPADSDYGVSPAFFTQMNEPRFVGLANRTASRPDDSRDSPGNGVIFYGKRLHLPFNPEIREITATITDEQVEERRRMRTDNDTASTSSLALTEMG